MTRAGCLRRLNGLFVYADRFSRHKRGRCLLIYARDQSTSVSKHLRDCHTASPPLSERLKRSQATSMEHTTLYLIPLVVVSLSFLLSVARERSRRERPKRRARTTLYSWREIFSALPGQNIKSPTGSVTVFTNDYDARKWNSVIVYWRVNRSFFSLCSPIRVPTRSVRTLGNSAAKFTFGEIAGTFLASRRTERTISNVKPVTSRDRFATVVGSYTFVDVRRDECQRSRRRDADEMENRGTALRAAPSSRKCDSPRRDKRFVAGDWRLKEQPRTMQLPWP